jgi:hypothetical protein
VHSAPHTDLTQEDSVWGALQAALLFVQRHESWHWLGVELVTMVESRMLLLLYSTSLEPLQKSVKVALQVELGQLRLDSHWALQFWMLQAWLMPSIPTVQESEASLHVDVKPAKKSQVRGLLSGLLKHVAMTGRLLLEQLTGAPDQQPNCVLQVSVPSQKRPLSQMLLLAA